MTTNKAFEHADHADRYRSEHSHVEAGDEYVLAAHEYLGAAWDHAAIQQLTAATLCYRLADSEYRVEYCVQTGEALCDRNKHEALETDSQHPYVVMKPGVWKEFKGDLLLVAGNDNWPEQYVAATEAYLNKGDCNLGIVENEHIRLIDMYKWLAKGSDHDTDYETVCEMESERRTCSDFVSFKRNTLPHHVETIVERGEWTWDDTE